jgi:hypothetical protein
MRDVFYTLLVVWVIWRIIQAINTQRSNQQQNNKSYSPKKEGETTLHFEPKQKNKKDDDEGEYVDYEEIK